MHRDRTMTPALENFIARAADATAGSALVEAISSFAEIHGFNRFNYLFAPPGRKLPTGITNYPGEWVERYIRQRYVEIDPVVIAARRGLRPLAWDSQNPDRRVSHAQRRFFDEAMEFRINCGVTVPVHDGQGGSALVTFASDRPLTTLRRSIEENQRILHIAAIEFHFHARKRLAAPAEIDHLPLSPREADCLLWIAEGKHAWEIAEILGVTLRTVVFHLQNAKRKLKAVTLPQAAVMALRHGNARLTAARIPSAAEIPVRSFPAFVKF